MHYGNKRLQEIDGQLLTDQNYFAEQYRQHEEEERDRLANSFHQAECEDFDNDFGDNNDFGGVDFNDALEADVPEVATSETQSVMGKRRPEYVNFSRVAKRVDVKLLKDNLWVVMKNQLADQKEDSPDKEEVAENRLPLISKVLFKMFYVHTDQSRQRIYQLVLFYLCATSCQRTWIGYSK